MANAEMKNLSSPDETRQFEKGKMEVVNIGGGTVGRATFQPGNAGTRVFRGPVV